MTKNQKIIWIIADALIGLLVCVGISMLLTAKTRNPEPTFAIFGSVTDSKTGQPIVGAKASDDQYGPKPYQSGTTDANGKYRFLTWPEEHSVMVEATGYKTSKHNLTRPMLRKTTDYRLDVALEPK